MKGLHAVGRGHIVAVLPSWILPSVGARHSPRLAPSTFFCRRGNDAVAHGCSLRVCRSRTSRLQRPARIVAGGTTHWGGCASLIGVQRAPTSPGHAVAAHGFSARESKTETSATYTEPFRERKLGLRSMSIALNSRRSGRPPRRSASPIGWSLSVDWATLLTRSPHSLRPCGMTKYA
jgi:hypothetical protein